MPDKRFAIGIDLGTTNSSLAYVDLEDPDGKVQVLPIKQWENASQLIDDAKLPSFLWLLPKSDLKKTGGRPHPCDASALQNQVLGREARGKALDDPERVIHSAKSWLSSGPMHTRTARCLPWASASVEDKLSPVDVQAALLRHLRLAWDKHFPRYPFQEQAIVITVPASFDELAQRLTLDAAKQAAYPDSVALLEEPQAAFYDWHQDQTKNGTLLVCDLGGGTCDFTLLKLQKDKVERVRVSEHILLGGDNIDLALAHAIAAKLSQEELGRSSWNLLLAQCRSIKEAALSEAEAGDVHISIPKDPKQLFGAYLTTSVTHAELRALILDGFFPEVAGDAHPQVTKETALHSLGLPYAQDSAVTRHLAAFLKNERIDFLLCVGGSLLPPVLRERLHQVLRSWQGDQALERLDHDSSDLAIARGAARFAYLRALARDLVQSDYPRTLLLELDAKGQKEYLTLIPRGHPRLEASRLTLPGLHVRVGSTVRFQIYSSLNPAPSESLREKQDDWSPLPALETRLAKKGAKKGESIPVALEAVVRETGILEIICRSEDLSWSLDFPTEGRGDQPKASGQTTALPHLDQAKAFLKDAFHKASALEKGEQIPKKLEQLLGSSRESWSASTLRALWPALEAAMFHRQGSQEATWYYLAGFCLRPGWGMAGDEDRMASLMRVYDESFRRVDSEARLADQWCILWRRVAGGLAPDTQQKLFDRYMPVLRKDKACSPELIRLLGSLELLSMTHKTQLGRLLVQQLLDGVKVQVEARVWALARLSSRVPLHAGPEAVLPPVFIEEWADKLEAIGGPTKQKLTLFYAWAGRFTGERLLDLDPRYRQLFAEKLSDESARRSIHERVAFDARMEQQMFGESLPSGFVIH